MQIPLDGKVFKNLCSVVSVPGFVALGFSTALAVPATFGTPSGVAVKKIPLIVYVADYVAVRKIVGNTVTTLAGPHDLTPPIHTCANGYVDGTGQNARFNYISAITVGQTTGNVYVTEHTNNTVRKITPAGVVTTLAGQGPTPPSASQNPSVDGIGTAATFKHPNGIVIDNAEQYLYVADSYDYSIRRITIGTMDVKTIVAHGALSNPDGIAIDPVNNNVLYVIEQGWGRVRKLNMSLYAGTPLPASALPIVPAPPLNFNQPVGIAVNSAGTIFLTEGNGSGTTYNHIRKGSVSTTPKAVVAGMGPAGLVDAVNGTAAKFDTPAGIALDPTGLSLFIADQRNNVVRAMLTVPPYSVTIAAGHAPGHPNRCANGTI